MLALIGWPILNRRQMRKRVTVGQYFDSGLPKDRRKKAPRSHLRRLFPLPSFAARLENGARTPNGLVVRAPSAILRSGCFGGWRRARERALPNENNPRSYRLTAPELVQSTLNQPAGRKIAVHWLCGHHAYRRAA